MAFLENESRQAIHDILELIGVVARKDGRGVSSLVDMVLIANRLRNALKAHELRMVSRNDCQLNRDPTTQPVGAS